MHQLRPWRPTLVVALALALLVGASVRPALAEEDQAAAPRRPMLWVVDSEPKIYLFGTIHLPDPRVLEHPDVVAKAIEESGALYTEIALDQANMQSMARRMLLPEGQSLDQLLPKELYDRLNERFTAKGMPLQMMNRFKIWVVYFRLMTLDIDLEKAQGKLALDAAIYQDAAKAEKTVGGLETPDEQLDIFDSLTTGEQVRLLEETLTAMDKAREEGVNPVEKMMEIYLRGDPEVLLKAMYAQMDPDDELSVRLLRKILDERNVRMVRRMFEKAEGHPDKTQFVAVGAGHLPGEMGILALLERSGYRVRRLATLADLENPFPLARKPSAVATTRPAAAFSGTRRRARRHVRFGPFCIPEIRWPWCCPRPCP